MNMQSLEAGAKPAHGRPWVMSAVSPAAHFAAGVVRRLGWLTARAARQALPGWAKPEAMLSDRNDGPPDLDELWKDLNRKLSNIFSGRGGDSGGPGGNLTPDANGAGIGIGLIVALIVLIWLGSGFYIVQEGQQGVVTTFGRYSYKVDAGFQ